MIRRPNAATKVLIEIFDDRLNYFAGDPTIPLDDIIEEFRKRVGGRLKEADANVHRWLRSAMTILKEDDRYGVRGTEYYWLHREEWPGRHPVTQADIVRSVSVSSIGNGTYCIHFCPKDDCVLFMQNFDHNCRSGEGKVKAQVGQMLVLATAGSMTPDAITQIASNAKLGPRKDIGRAVRIAAKVQQQRLPA